MKNIYYFFTFIILFSIFSLPLYSATSFKLVSYDSLVYGICHYPIPSCPILIQNVTNNDIPIKIRIDIKSLSHDCSLNYYSDTTYYTNITQDGWEQTNPSILKKGQTSYYYTSISFDPGYFLDTLLIADIIVTVFNVNDPADSLQFPVYFQYRCSDSEPLINWNDIKVYPNPANDYLSIDMNYEQVWIQQFDNLEIKFFNSFGQEIHPLSCAFSGNQFSINISNLPSAVYYFLIKDNLNNKAIKSFRIIR